MKKTIALFLIFLLCGSAFLRAQENYEPSPENLKARQEFSGFKLGIFIHWGIYSMFGQGEWYLHTGKLNKDEYAKAASGFYPARFNAEEWVSAIKNAGAKYITITSRHHDGFSMFDTKASEFNICKATPFKRDVIKELAEECHKQNIGLNFYYSLLDWTREDYPWSKSGMYTGRDKSKWNYPSYYQFMSKQLTELLTNYGKIGAIWFDGWWDHKDDKPEFNWNLSGLYSLIHKLQPSCLVINNHHVAPFPGEDAQTFERDLPGENKAGYSKGQEVTNTMPLETCQTMNGMWGYKVADQDYKSTEEILQLLIGAASKGGNLLLNIGPQPNGELPATALNRLKEVGKWMRQNGETLYDTTRGDLQKQPWGVTTRKGNKLYLHIFKLEGQELTLPLECKVKKAQTFASKQAIKFKKDKTGTVTLFLPEQPQGVDYIVELETSEPKA